MKYRYYLERPSYRLFLGWADSYEDARKKSMEYIKTHGYEPDPFIRTWKQNGGEYIDFGYGDYIVLEEC